MVWIDTETDKLLVEALFNFIFNGIILIMGGFVTYWLVERYQRKKGEMEIRKGIIDVFSDYFAKCWNPEFNNYIHILTKPAIPAVALALRQELLDLGKDFVESTK